MLNANEGSSRRLDGGDSGSDDASKVTTTRNGTVALGRAECSSLLALITQFGLPGATKRFGVSRMTLAAAVAGLGIRRANADAIRRKLAEHGDRP